MRVIAGTARSVPLMTPEGDGTRPTTDRIKETLFNIISDDLYDCMFLDLFAGSGQIGIEALSRGAKKAVFVEKNKKIVELIKQNLKKTKLEDGGVVIRSDAVSCMPMLLEHGAFDIIYMDPPYANKKEHEILKAIEENGILADDGMIIIEAALDNEVDVSDIAFTIVREKSYKTNKHIFIKKK